jgi:multiple sugar transport system permease protein
MLERRTKYRIKRIFLLYIPLLMFLSFTLFPIYWMVNTSLKPSEEIFKRPITYIPKKVTFQHYLDAWRFTLFPRYFVNSVVVASISGIATVTAAIFGGYSLSRYRFKGKNIILVFFLITQMVPFVLLIVPLYIIFARLGLIDTHIALMLAYTALNIPFCTMMMSSFFDGIPVAIEECAKVDGATLLQTMFRITIPLVLPGIAATFIFAFIYAWNELLLGIIFINSERLKTIPVGLATFIQRYDILWGQMTAVGTMGLLPAVLLFFIAQKRLVEGLTLGATKG